MKQIAGLLAIFIALLGGYLITKEYAEPKAYTPPDEVALDGWTQEKFIEVHLEGTSKASLVKQEDDTWKVNEFKADQAKLDVFLANLAAAKVTSQVSSNPENHERFQVTENGVKLEVVLDDGTRDIFIIGKGSGANSVYLRVPNKKEVYSLSGVSQPLFRQELTLWRERTLTKTQAAQVESIYYVDGRNSYTVEQQNDTWVLSRPGSSSVELAIEQVFPWLGKVLGVQAGEYPSQERIEALLEQDARQEVTISSADQEELWLIYPSEDENFYDVIRSNDQAGFSVSKSLLDDQFLPYNDLRDQLDGE